MSNTDKQTKELYQWVKASERLPNKKMIGEWFNIKLRGYPAGAGRFIKTIGDGILTFDIDKYGKGESETFHHIEWLELLPSPAHTEVTDTRVEDIVSDEKVNKVWANANFGDVSKRDIIKDTIMHVVQGYSCGSTAKAIIIELGLVDGKKWCLTELGVKYLKAMLALPVQSPTDTEFTELKRLYEWLMDENRKKAQTFFTSGDLRNVAKEIEFRLWQKTDTPIGYTVEDVAGAYSEGYNRHAYEKREEEWDDEIPLDKTAFLNSLKQI